MLTGMHPDTSATVRAALVVAASQEEDDWSLGKRLVERHRHVMQALERDEAKPMHTSRTSGQELLDELYVLLGGDPRHPSEHLQDAALGIAARMRRRGVHLTRRADQSSNGSPS